MKKLIMGTSDDQLKIRKARREYSCQGDGAHPDYRRFATGCTSIIRRGDKHLECLWESSPFQSGSRHCLACSKEFFGVENK